MRPGPVVALALALAHREKWLCSGGEWKLHFVDRIRDQRRLVDSQPA